MLSAHAEPDFDQLSQNSTANHSPRRASSLVPGGRAFWEPTCAPGKRGGDRDAPVAAHAPQQLLGFAWQVLPAAPTALQGWRRPAVVCKEPPTQHQGAASHPSRLAGGETGQKAAAQPWEVLRSHHRRADFCTSSTGCAAVLSPRPRGRLPPALPPSPPGKEAAAPGGRGRDGWETAPGCSQDGATDPHLIKNCSPHSWGCCKERCLPEP